MPPDMDTLPSGGEGLPDVPHRATGQPPPPQGNDYQDREHQARERLDGSVRVRFRVPRRSTVSPLPGPVGDRGDGIVVEPLLPRSFGDAGLFARGLQSERIPHRVSLKSINTPRTDPRGAGQEPCMFHGIPAPLAR
jgi:hypothetical protein